MSRRLVSATLSFILFFSILLSGCAREKVMIARPFARTTDNKAIQSANKLDVFWWRMRHQQVVEHVKKGHVNLLLIGDSITHGWDSYPDLWQKHFAAHNTVNLGFSGDQTQHVLWRLQHGEIDGISPQAAMIMIGTNNSNGDEYTAEEIADGIVAICRELRTKLPGMRILLLAIFPRNEKPGLQREKNAKASLLVSQIADGKHIFFLDINEKFLAPNGTLTKEIMPDFLHPSKKGYELWSAAVMPKLNELLRSR